MELLQSFRRRRLLLALHHAPLATDGPAPHNFASTATVFEALVNSIACQQVSLDLGIVLLNRLSERFGAQFVTRSTVLYAFPTPADLADMPRMIRDWGIAKARRTGLHHSRRLSRGRHANRWPLPLLSPFAAPRGVPRARSFATSWADPAAMFHLPMPARPSAVDTPGSTEGVVDFHLLLDRLRASGSI